MADNGAEPEKTRLGDQDVEAGNNVGDELDDSKAKFINGGLDDTKVEVKQSPTRSATSFTGLSKEELKKYAEDPFWVRLRWILFILFWVGWLAMLVSAIIIIVLAPRCPSRPDLKWYHKDVSYNIYSKSFLDADKTQDGYGDLEGIQKKESFVEGLGANVMWLSSIFKTEANNDRAVIDYKELDEKFGTLQAFQAFCKQLMKKGRRVIVDLIPNQTSKNHTWFMKSQGKDGKYTNYYVWTKTPNNWQRDTRKSMWVLDPARNEYYLSQFGDLPDLNLTNPDVIAEFKEIIGFWAGKGVSGFHVNDLEYLAENRTLMDDDFDKTQTRNFAGNVDVVDSLRKIVDGLDNKPGREKLVFGTVTKTTSMEQMKQYFGQGGKRGLHMVSVVLSDLTRNVDALDLETKLEPFINISTKHWLGWRLTTPEPNSDRVFNRVGNNRVIIAHALQALLPGSSLPYYGDEIAMENGQQASMKTVTPMQWTNGPYSGFTTGNPWLPVNPGYVTKNKDSLTAQLTDNTMMKSFQAVNQLRMEESLLFGKTRFCSSGDLFIFARHAPGFSPFIVIANLGGPTAYKFTGSQCLEDLTSSELVFHSQGDHHDSAIDLGRSIHIGGSEVLVLKFPPK